MEFGQYEGAYARPNPLPGWTKEEKVDLMEAIYIFGSYDIASIHDRMPEKSKFDIESAIEYYRAKALQKFHANPKKYKKSGETSKNSGDEAAGASGLSTSKKSTKKSHWTKLFLECPGSDKFDAETIALLKLAAQKDEAQTSSDSDNSDGAHFDLSDDFEVFGIYAESDDSSAGSPKAKAKAKDKEDASDLDGAMNRLHLWNLPNDR